ncbi:hypothetical protein CANCADRAFT_106721 [Tortispora caseinolytica NRRL Y-17796]|uniref:BRO1 domain-containing protein n=1 Tax=Tortispora caseinolytica NRRL Y-17796 TaxID=767744 RepID=A0A1E4TFA9_9ASCO|nr:hypothetical protein CANCADRAFT_106721 [Tortispora caseinolytica NRRL Y-17796]
MDLLDVPLRNPEPVSFNEPIRKYIEEVHENAAAYAADIAELQLARDLLTSQGGVHNYKAYAKLLLGAMKKLPPDIGINFTWHSSIGHSQAPVRYSSLQFELCNVVYNIAALYTHVLPDSHAPLTADELKFMAQSLQLGVGLFEYTATLISKLPFVPPLELDVYTLNTLVALCKAQAQECFWRRAALDKMKSSSISRLAIQVSLYYTEAIAAAQKSCVIPADWIHHLTVKKSHFAVAAYYRQALAHLEKSQYGAEVAYLKKAVELSKEGSISAKYTSQPVSDAFAGLLAKVQSDLISAERDNDMIYLQQEPTSIGLIEPANMTVSRLPDDLFVDSTTMRHEPLFKSLLPFAARRAILIYKDRATTLVEAKVLAAYSNLKADIVGFLAKLELPGSLEAIEKPLGVPRSILTQSNEVRGSGGIEMITRALNDVTEQAKMCNSIVDELLQRIDAKQTASLSSGPSSSAVMNKVEESESALASLRDEVVAYKDTLSTAAEQDDIIQRRISHHGPLISILGQTEDIIATTIPNAQVLLLDDNLKKAIFDLRSVLSELYSESAQWDKRIQQIKVRLEMDSVEDDIRKEMRDFEEINDSVSLTAERFEPVIQDRLLRQYDSDLNMLSESRKRVNDLFKEVEKANQIFQNSRARDQWSIRRSEIIQKLNEAYAEYNRLKGFIEQTRNFYNNASNHVNILARKVKAFVKSLEIEFAEMSIINEDRANENEGEDLSGIISPQPRAAQGKIWTADQSITFQE